MNRLFGIRQVESVTFPHFVQSGVTLTVFENGAHVPFSIERAFAINAPKGTVRGEHAHQQCTQLLVCLAGRCEVEIDDTAEKMTRVLANPSEGLLVPPSLWLKLSFPDPVATVLVLCDRRYEEDDYIRDYKQFVNWRQSLDCASQ